MQATYLCTVTLYAITSFTYDEKLRLSANAIEIHLLSRILHPCLLKSLQISVKMHLNVCP